MVRILGVVIGGLVLLAAGFGPMMPVAECLLNGGNEVKDRLEAA